jgi:hypothetical protein
VLTDTTESEGEGNFALYTRYCQQSFFVDLGCTPYFIGPIPLWSTKEKGFVLTGPLDGRGGASGGMAVPPELQQYQSRNGGGSYYGGAGGGGAQVQMDEDCLNGILSVVPGAQQEGANRNIPILIEAANKHGLDRAQIAYVLATLEREVGPYGWDPTYERGRPCRYSGGCGWYGRGYVQLTHDYNYARVRDELGYDVVSNPDLAYQSDIAAEITITGMMQGWYNGHGHGLGHYVSDEHQDFYQARRTVNVLDHAGEIAANAEQYYQALQSCQSLETTSGAAAGDLNAAIMNAISEVQAEGFSASVIPGTNNGRLGCAGAVNYVLSSAGIEPLGPGAHPWGSLSVAGSQGYSVEEALQGGRGVAVEASEAQPGDLNIIDMGGSRHIGICINVGCTRVVSNSSTRAGNGQPSFVWESDGYFTPSYGGGRRAIYRVTN